jgi:hypothetical protein
MIDTYTPSDFQTQTTPNVRQRNGQTKYTFRALLARRQPEYYFVDYLFEYDNGLHGATGTTMVPVSYVEMERREEEMRDYEWSPLAHIYDEQNTPVSWDEWIDKELDRRGWLLLYDPSYESRYGPIVREKATGEDGYYDEGEIAVVECIGGGRMFSRVERNFDDVYDKELLRLVLEAEENGVGNLY